jgi:glucose/arabinose dehydrogenase
MSSSPRRASRALVHIALLAVVLAATALPFATASGASSSGARGAIGAGLRGPSGLTATVDADGLKHVSALTTDAQDRVWVATAAASDKGKDAIYFVTSAGATPQKIVTDVHTPLGIVWIGDTLYVSQADGVLALTGFDGTTFASRSTIVSFRDGTGEVNGITVGRDGRLSVGISAPCNSCTTTGQYSASIVSFQPDGSDLQVYASGIRAPIGLEFFPGTDDLFVTMNQRDDLGAETPGDWLSVVRAGESWGFPSYYGQTGVKYAGRPRPVAELDEHAAVSGVALVTGQLGSSVGTGAVVAEWVTGKVQLVHLTATVDGYTGTTVSFLSGFENPVPVLLDAHGALFVGDWTSGKVYRIST